MIKQTEKEKIQQNFDKKTNNIENCNNINSALLFYQTITNNNLNWREEIAKVHYLYKLFGILKTAPDSMETERIIKMLGNITPFEKKIIRIIFYTHTTFWLHGWGYRVLVIPWLTK